MHLKNIKNAKVIGAGSIGNHLTNALVELGSQVNIFDISETALNRTKNLIYPSRYGEWNSDIGLFNYNDNHQHNYDLIVIGTPPDTHKNILLEELKNKPKAILLEKPLFKYSDNIENIQKILLKTDVKIFTGYNHTVSQGVQYLIQNIKDNKIGKINKIEVRFLENWEGIFKAHPWLNGPEDSYLGFWRRGGGALSEHSHALNLLIYLYDVFKLQEPIISKSSISLNKNEIIEYDKSCKIFFSNSEMIEGYVEQDVVTKPTQKTIDVFGDKGSIRWQCCYENNDDAILINDKLEKIIKKNRKDDFKEEITHIDNYFNNYQNSPLRIDLGIRTAQKINQIYSNNIS